MTPASQLSDSDIAAFEPEAKIALLATVNPRGEPHISLITSLQAKDPSTLMWGQFSEGVSKQNVHGNPQNGFLVMNDKRQLWRGKAEWTAAVHEGDDYVHYNQLPMFRYNSYFGIHTVHYMDLIQLTHRCSLPVASLLAGLALVEATRRSAQTKLNEPILKPWAEKHFRRPATLTFLSYVDREGFPVIVGVLPCTAADSRRLVFAPTVFRDELRHLAAGSTVAIFALNLQMESVLVRGRFNDYRRHWGGLTTGIVDIDWVYNSMPPKPGQIYPPVPLEPVVDF